MTLISTDWKTEPFPELYNAVKTDDFWGHYLATLGANPTYSVHLAVFRPPFLDYILKGLKTVESRFSAVRCAPYDRVEKGDVLLPKSAGGPVLGISLVDRVWSYELDPITWDQIRHSFAKQLCALDPEFWRQREASRFAPLMRVSRSVRLPPIPWRKRDRRGWVVLHPRRQQLTTVLG